MAWNLISDATLATDQPSSSLTMKQLRDNVAGAFADTSTPSTSPPKVQTAAIQDLAVTNAKIASLATTKLTGTVSNAQISAVDGGKITTGTLPNARIATNAITSSKINIAFGGLLSVNVVSGSYWTIPKGIHTFESPSATMMLVLNSAVAYEPFGGGTVFADGSANFRIYNSSLLNSTLYYRTLS